MTGVDPTIILKNLAESLLELGEPAYTIATIASRAGKSEAYVYGRVRLADLIPISKAWPMVISSFRNASATGVLDAFQKIEQLRSI